MLTRSNRNSRFRSAYTAMLHIKLTVATAEKFEKHFESLSLCCNCSFQQTSGFRHLKLLYSVSLGMGDRWFLLADLLRNYFIADAVLLVKYQNKFYFIDRSQSEIYTCNWYSRNSHLTNHGQKVCSARVCVWVLFYISDSGSTIDIVNAVKDTDTLTHIHMMIII